MKILSPFKWAGSKSKERKKLYSLLGNESFAIAEPFMGTGIVSGMFGRKNACFGNDLNHDIINLFSYYKNDQFKAATQQLFTLENFSSHDFFYNTRAELNKTPIKTLDRAILFFFIQNCAHFGLYRLNKSGEYTSTWHFFDKNPNWEARYASLAYIAEKFRYISEVDYKVFLETLPLNEVELLFLDPPYIEAAYGDYSVNDKKVFGHDDLKFLDSYCESILDKGVRSILCNYATPNDSDLYKGATKIINFTSNRSMNLNSVSHKRESIYVLYGDFEKNTLPI